MDGNKENEVRDQRSRGGRRKDSCCRVEEEVALDKPIIVLEFVSSHLHDNSSLPVKYVMRWYEREEQCLPMTIYHYTLV